MSRREAPARRNGLAVDGDDGLVARTDNVGLTPGEGLIENRGAALPCDGFDVDVVRNGRNAFSSRKGGQIGNAEELELISGDFGHRQVIEKVVSAEGIEPSTY
jgi:hypothetical protein